MRILRQAQDERIVGKPAPRGAPVCLLVVRPPEFRTNFLLAIHRLLPFVVSPSNHRLG